MGFISFSSLEFIESLISLRQGDPSPSLISSEEPKTQSKVPSEGLTVLSCLSSTSASVFLSGVLLGTVKVLEEYFGNTLIDDATMTLRITRIEKTNTGFTIWLEATSRRVVRLLCSLTLVNTPALNGTTVAFDYG